MTGNALDEQIGGNHYKKFKIQPMEFCYENGIPSVESSIIKYVVRHRDKNGKQDLEKAAHLIRYLIEKEYS